MGKIILIMKNSSQSSKEQVCPICFEETSDVLTFSLSVSCMAASIGSVSLASITGPR